MRKNKVHNASAEEVRGVADKEPKEREDAAEIIQGQLHAFGEQFSNLLKSQLALFPLGS